MSLADPPPPPPVALSKNLVNSIPPSRFRSSPIPIAPSQGFRKNAFRIALAAKNLVDLAGRDCVLFATLTFRRTPATLETAVGRFQLLASALRREYPDLLYLWVAGRFASGGFHLHALFATGEDMIAGTDMSLCACVDPSPADLRAALNSNGQRFWISVSRAGRPHGLGRISLFPICTCPEAVASYLARNYTEAQERRVLSDYRRRTWGMSRAIPRPPDARTFSLNRPANVRHRQRLAEGARRMHGIGDFEEAVRILGPSWHFDLCRAIYHPPGWVASPGAMPVAPPTPKGGGATRAGDPGDTLGNGMGGPA